MILHLSDSFSRGLVVVAALLIGFWLSFIGLRTAIARYGYEGDTAARLQLAVRLEPGNPNYWYRLGRYQQNNLEAPNSALAKQFYRKTLALNPFDTEALLDLATEYELEGKNVEAHDAYLLARKSYPASADVSWRYGNFLLRQGNQPEAYAELRRAIEADPQRAALAFSLAYRTKPDVGEILNGLLPAKQSAYLGMINEAVSENQIAVARILWTRMLALHPRLKVRDFEPLVSRLLEARDDEEARRVWDQGMATLTLPPLLQLQDSVVWDPSFESGINDSVFGWQYKPIEQGVSIGLDKADRHSGNQALRLSFDGKHNPSIAAACTLVLVRPNIAYHFSGWIKTKEITTAFGVGFRLQALGASGDAFVSTQQIFGSHPFTRIDQTWIAGADTRRIMICVVREPSDNPGVRISGTAWVDDVNLVPQPTEPRAP